MLNCDLLFVSFVEAVGPERYGHSDSDGRSHGRREVYSGAASISVLPKLYSLSYVQEQLDFQPVDAGEPCLQGQA